MPGPYQKRNQHDLCVESERVIIKKGLSLTRGGKKRSQEEKDEREKTSEVMRIRVKKKNKEESQEEVGKAASRGRL